jgi:hypothetical protein
MAATAIGSSRHLDKAFILVSLPWIEQRYLESLRGA